MGKVMGRMAEHGDTTEPAGAGAEQAEALSPGQLFYLLHHVVRQRETALTALLISADLTLTQWQVLSLLEHVDRATMGEVAELCATDRTTLTRTVDRMVDDGLVRRDRAGADRRQVILELTEAGLVRYEQAYALVGPFNQRLTNFMSPKDFGFLAKLIRRSLTNVTRDEDWVDDLMSLRIPRAKKP